MARVLSEHHSSLSAASHVCGIAGPGIGCYDMGAMRLPEAERLVVEREKVAEYLLNPAHQYGASKARFVSGFGFRSQQWERLAEALRAWANARSCA